MTQATPEQSPHLAQLSLNQPAPWAVSLLGQEFNGEVVRANRWQPQWGQPLEAGSHFRLVLLTAPQEVAPGDLRDQRILVVAPEQPIPPRRLREIGPIYGTGRAYSLESLNIPLEQAFAAGGASALNSLAIAILIRSLGQAVSMAAEAADMRAYLEAATLPQGDELALDQASLLEQLTLGNLAAHPHLWPSLKSLFDWFRTHYIARYQGFHAHHRQEAARLEAQLREAGARLEALRRLNSIAELGPPVGQDLLSRYIALQAEARPCSLEAISLEAQPRCPQCRLALGASSPTSQIAEFLEALAQALGEQHRRLSSQAIRHILTQAQGSQIDRFLKVLQAANSSSLVQVLDDELVEFLRQLLRRARAIPFPILAQVKERFPTLDESQTEEAVDYFRSQLLEAFQEAGKRLPRPTIAPE